MNRSFALFLAMVLILLPVGISGQTGSSQMPLPGLYTVDYPLLLAMHPLLANFDLVLGRHLRSDLPFGNLEAMGKVTDQINQLAKKARAEADKLQVKLDKIQLAQADMHRRMDQVVVEFNKERGTYTGESTRKIQQEKLAVLDREYAELQKAQQKVWDDIMDPLYLPRAQSEALVNQALSEIDAVLNSMSVARGGAIIIDSDFVRVTKPAEHMFKAHTTGADPLSIRLYQSLLESDLVGKVPDAYQQQPDLRQYAAIMRKQIEESFDRNIAGQISRSPLYSSLVGQRGLFLTGGQQADLTKSVLAEIFRCWQVRPDIANRILAVVP